MKGKNFLKNSDRAVLTLNKLSAGQYCKVLGFLDGIGADIKRRVLELGFVCGASVVVSAISALGQVFLLEINGYMLAVRSNICECILVELV